MKNVLFWSAVLACVAGMARGGAEGSAVPSGFAYQGVLSDPVTGPLAGEQTVTFRLFDEASGGVPLWETNQVVVCSPEGLFHAWLEGGNEMVEAFLKQSDGPFGRYLELEVEGHGGAIAPRVEFTSAPQALLARRARQSAGGFTVAGDLTVAADGALQVAATNHFTGGASFGNLDVHGDAAWTGLAELNVEGTLEAGAFEGYGFARPGFITMWEDADNIPDGWALCDGNNGTPDLRDSFLVGVHLDPDHPPYATTNLYPCGATGGAASVVLQADQLPPHTHSYAAIEESASWDTHVPVSSYGDAFVASSLQQFESDTAGDGAGHENRPPYCALCFIMKL